jgi:TldD protein
MRSFALEALEEVRSAGADYADVRVVETAREEIGVKNGRVAGVARSDDRGFGIRALARGAWGFSSSALTSRDEARRVAREAVEIARASARLAARPVALAPVEPVVASWRTPFLRDPFDVPLDEKVDLLLAVDAAARRVAGVTVVQGEMSFRRIRKAFVSSEGAAIDQEILRSGVGYSVIAARGGDLQVRSYPNSFGGQFQTKGYEVIAEWPLVAEAERVASEAVALLSAEQCPSGVRDVLLDSSQLALQVHESCGHPIELDRVLGAEANYAGKSFLTPDLLGSFRYGSSAVSIEASALTPGGVGTYGFDDEGVPAQRWDIVREGLFTGYLTSRETAAAIGETASRGTMRADSWNRLPIIRMNNVNLLPGAGTLEDLIRDTDDGIYMETNRSWSIDQLRLNFQFGTEIGWEIKKGRKVRMLKNPTYGGTTPEFWRACDAVCGPGSWVLWGLTSCGKGQPGQLAETGHGAAPARFRAISVGGGYAR